MEDATIDKIAKSVAKAASMRWSRRQTLEAIVVSGVAIGATKRDQQDAEARSERKRKSGISPQRMDAQCKPPATNHLCDVPGHFDTGYKGKFRTACEHHDICYTTCGSDPLQCNKNFYSDMLSACKRAFSKGKDGADRVKCIARATAYYDAVFYSWPVYWNEAQDEYCCRDFGETCSSIAQCNDNPEGSASCDSVCDAQPTCCLNENWGYCYDDCECCGSLLCLPEADGHSYCTNGSLVASSNKQHESSNGHHRDRHGGRSSANRHTP